MKIKDGFLLRTLGDTHVVVPVGQASVDLRGMISLNATGAFLWEALQTEQSHDELVAKLLDAYDVEEARAAQDVARFVELLREHELLEQGGSSV